MFVPRVWISGGGSSTCSQGGGEAQGSSLETIDLRCSLHALPTIGKNEISPRCTRDKIVMMTERGKRENLMDGEEGEDGWCDVIHGEEQGKGLSNLLHCDFFIPGRY